MKKTEGLMRKISIILLAVLFLAVSFSISKAVEVSGVNLPNTYKVDNQTLVLNGAGSRTKFIFVKIYVGALYVQKKSHNPQDIFSQKLKVIRMHFTYPSISAEKIRNAFMDDFSRISPAFANSEIAKKFVSVFNFTVKKGDNIDLIFNGNTVSVVYNGKTLGKFTSPQLARVALAVYIGKKPTQSSLKEDLLGK